MKDEVEAMDTVSRKEYRKQAIASLEACAGPDGEMFKAAENGMFVSELGVVKAALAALRGEANASVVAQDAAREHAAATEARAEQKAGTQKQEETFEKMTGATPPPPNVAAVFDETAARETPYTWAQDDEGTVTVSIAVPTECKKSDVRLSALDRSAVHQPTA